MNIINEDYLVESIIGQSRHQFIYGNDEEKVDIAYRNVIDAYEIGTEPIERPKMILDIIK